MRRTIRLFLRFQGIYTTKWTSKFPNELSWALSVVEWDEALNEENIGNTQILFALKHVRRQNPWPPEIADFLEICSIYRDKDPLHAEKEELPPPPPTEEQQKRIDEIIAETNKILGIRKKVINGESDENT